MTDADLQKIRRQLAVYNSLFRPEAEALLAEVRRLRAEVRELREKVAGLEAYAQHLEKTADPG
jgi:prefoldin subunit 5